MLFDNLNERGAITDLSARAFRSLARVIREGSGRLGQGASLQGHGRGAAAGHRTPHHVCWRAKGTDLGALGSKSKPISMRRIDLKCKKMELKHSHNINSHG